MTRFIPLFLLVMLSCEYPQGDSKFDPEMEKAAILEMANARFQRMVAAKTGAEMARVYVENTIENPVYLPQNNVVLVGRAAIVDWATGFFNTYELAFGKEGPFFDEWVIRENLAVHRYVARGYFVERSSGDSIRTDQKATDVFEKINGEWQFSSHMWNTNSMDIQMFNLDCVGNQ